MTSQRSCTSLDHIWLVPAAPGKPCLCGKRTWAGVPRAALTLKVGEQVTVSGEVRVVASKLRGEDVYRLSAPVKGRTLFDREELTRV